MRVVLCEQGALARVVEVDNELTEFQSLVDGLIESVPVIDGIVMICNEEGNLREDLLPNRFISVRNQLEVIKGNFFFCGFDGSNFKEIPRNKEPILLALFQKPDFDKKGNRIV